MNKPRLIHLTTVDFSLAALLARQLERFEDEGFEVAGAAAPTGYSSALARRGIRFIPVDSLTRTWAPAEDAKALADLTRLFRDERPSIVHTHNPKSGVLGRMAARAAGVPVIVNTVHGLYANPALSSARRTLIAAAERGAATLSHHEFFQSVEDYDFAIRTRMVGRTKASVLGNGVDLSVFDPEKVTKKRAADLRRSWGATPSKVVVGTVGRLVLEKGLGEFIRAAVRLREKNPRLVFVVVGPEEASKDDRLRPADIARARDQGIVFPGEQDSMPGVYAAFDIFVLASHREGMPRSAIEAAAMGKPSIVTDIRGCREVVQRDDTGLIVPARNSLALEEAIERLAGEPDVRLRLGAAARERAVEHFDEEDVIRRTLTVYRRLLASKGIS
jgi:glycosyltransferase involved in cell wall biosynthesis